LCICAGVIRSGADLAQAGASGLLLLAPDLQVLTRKLVDERVSELGDVFS